MNNQQQKYRIYIRISFDRVLIVLKVNVSSFFEMMTLAPPIVLTLSLKCLVDFEHAIQSP